MPIGTTWNRSWRKKSTELMASERKLSTVFLHSPAFIILARLRDGKFIDVNESFCQLTGYSREELLNSTGLDDSIFSQAPNMFLKDRVNSEGAIDKLEIQIRTKAGDLLTAPDQW